MSAALPDPRILNLPDAVGEIHQACEVFEDRPHQTPFFLVVGAGISMPPVPLARAVIDHCQGVAQKYKRGAPMPQGSTLDEYSHWFSRAYPGARQRQEYLRGLIERKPLSLATLRLAHLLSARRLTNLVITTNFDDFIARGLRLFGQEPAVCDHPRTVGRIDRERPDIQIVHVHGSYIFYDCANLRAEVGGRARTDEETPFTMVGLLDGLLWNRSPLVVGYSGWEGDVVMSALKRRLRSGNPLGQNMYWFCYRRSEHDSLPAWLRESQDIRFVVPPEQSPAETTKSTRREIGEDVPPEPTLSAVQVFDELKAAFGVGQPELFANPIEYFARSLEMSLPDAVGNPADPYAFKALIERLHRAAKNFESTTAPRGMEATLDRLRGLMRDAQYTDAINILAGIIPAKLPKLDDPKKAEVYNAARLASAAQLAKLGTRKPSPNLASMLVFDGKMDESFAKAPSSLAWLIGSRLGQHGFETSSGGTIHGAFTANLLVTLRDPKSDLDGDGRISLLEATMQASRRMLKEYTYQSPVAGGKAAQISFFTTKGHAGGSSSDGILHAVLVGVSRYKMKNVDLAGPVNDVKSMSELLARRDGRRLYSRVQEHRLLDSEATAARFRKLLEGIAEKAKRQDIVLVYFSGHAFREPMPEADPGRKTRRTAVVAEKNAASRLVLAMHDFAQRGTGAVEQSELFLMLESIAADRLVLILDF